MADSKEYGIRRFYSCQNSASSSFIFSQFTTSNGYHSLGNKSWYCFCINRSSKRRIAPLSFIVRITRPPAWNTLFTAGLQCNRDGTYHIPWAERTVWIKRNRDRPAGWRESVLSGPTWPYDVLQYLCGKRAGRSDKKNAAIIYKERGYLYWRNLYGGIWCII